MKSAADEGLRAIAFLGGGTGGHLFPGIALAERARERFPGCRTLFFRTARAVEDKVFLGRDLETRSVSIAAPGGSFRGWVRYALEAQAVRRELEGALQGFDAAFGLGGYASFPGILAARSLGVPVILLEQNLAPGRVNRLLAPFAEAVACPFAETPFRMARRRVVTGNPVRKVVLEAAAARDARAMDPARRRILVVGGSQGAAGVNRAVRAALPELLDFRERIHWIHVAGDADKGGMTEAYRTGGWSAEVYSYTPELPSLMAGSDLLLGRAGGTTLSEIAVLGLPAVLVPYPYHRDQHQRRNAEAFARAGGAEVIEEDQLTAGSLRAVFRDTLFAPARLEAMGRCARSLARPDAADAILDLAVELRRRCPPASASSS
ncbi:MAG: UDP-N-acetylglucosamine--N-acetylmuramyl-(pentapeptide) pyrophosphoryl-undecaprenol N-acetylglucosamine transferase [Planctomycetes bacterium]|nr:UDP-N-acetylglucosamine--N-acetylmuramyl-(pentapeptide) pyrophosphoryl-undecaprenol N-acetylglucosamine transferase [Planctomycetota bacterium]